MREPDPRHRVFYWNGALAVTCCLVTLVLATYTPRYGDSPIVFLMYGSLFGQTAIAAGWTAFGPGQFIIRWPLAMLWVTILIVIATMPVVVQGEYGVALLYGFWFGGQYLLSVIVLGGLALGCRLRLRYQRDTKTEFMREGQFGIRQLIFFTAIIAVILGIGRILVPMGLPDLMGGPWTILLFMIVAEGVLTLPLISVIFLRRWTVVATVGCLLFTAAATPFELALFKWVAGPAVDLTSVEFGLTNLIGALVILLFGITTRQSGYHFGRPESLASQVASPADGR